MSRRIALPGADELFRSTGDAVRGTEAEAAVAPAGTPTLAAVAPAPAGAPQGLSQARQSAPSLAAAPQSPVEVEPGLETDSLQEAAAAVRSVPRRRPRAVSDRQPSGRERHDEKITVYVSPDELMDLEHARLTLRGDFGLSVDRGRVVREALAVVLADLEAKGDASILVRRLRGR